jgi:hypothetical protein
MVVNIAAAPLAVEQRGNSSYAPSAIFNGQAGPRFTGHPQKCRS